MAPRALPDGIPPAVVRSLVATSRHLTALSVDCLRFYLDGFRAIRPSHPIAMAEDLGRLPVEIQRNYEMEPWKDRPKVRVVPVQDEGPPTWLEEQRVIRAFWCLQTIVDLHKAAAASHLGGWPPEDVKYLRDCDATTVWSLEKLLRRHLARRMVCGTLAQSVQYREILTVIWYLEAVHRRRWPEPKPPKRLEVAWDGPAPRRGRHDLKRLCDASEAAGLYAHLQSLSHTSLGRYAPYNALGFALWCDKRMRAAGLLWPNTSRDGGGGTIWRQRFVAYAWLSVLRMDDRQRLTDFRWNQHELAQRPPGPEDWQAQVGFLNTEAGRRCTMQRNWVPYLSIDIS